MTRMISLLSGVAVVTMLTVSASPPAAGQEFMGQLNWSNQQLQSAAKKKRKSSASGGAREHAEAQKYVADQQASARKRAGARKRLLRR